MERRLLEQMKGLEERPFWDWPDDAASWVLKALQSDDKEPRLIAIQLVHQLVDDELAEELVRILRTDPDAEMAGAAAIALGPALEECSIEYDDGMESMPDLPPTAPLSHPVYLRIQTALKETYHDADRPEVVRRRALEAAVRAPLAWHSDAVRAAYQSSSQDWQMTAVFGMGFLQGFDTSILEALQSDHQGTRREALLAAGRREIEAAGPDVLKVAADSDAAVELRLSAIIALETLVPPGSQELLEQLLEDEDDEIAETARDTLEEREVFAALDEDLVDDDPF